MVDVNINEHVSNGRVKLICQYLIDNTIIIK